MNTQISPNRQRLISDIKLKLGGNVIRNELTTDHFDYAVREAIDRYRQRSGNSLEESFIVMELQPDVQTYTLPQEVQEVRDIYRRNIGSNSAGSSVDPFSLAFTNNIYQMQNPGGLGGGSSGALVNYELAMDYQKLIGRMFGTDIPFTWNSATKRLFCERKFYAVEVAVLHVYNKKPDETLILDDYARPWIRDFATASCKMMLAQIRGKFSSGLGGPQGSITLNADALKGEAEAEFLRLEEEMKMGIDQSTGYGFLFA